MYVRNHSVLGITLSDYVNNLSIFPISLVADRMSRQHVAPELTGRLEVALDFATPLTSRHYLVVVGCFGEVLSFQGAEKVAVSYIAGAF